MDTDTQQDVVDIGRGIGLVLDGEEREEEEEPPSLNDQLEHFREQWRQELYLRKTKTSSESDRASLQEQAKQYFMTGSRLEQEGSLFEAIQFYRHAMRLVPDIENLIQLDLIGHSPRERQASESSVESFDGEIAETEGDLATLFQDLQLEEKGWCVRELNQRACHISALPTEVMIYILKWVISTQLDMRSLENVAMVCRGFYLFARDDELWRLACYRIWGANTGKVKKFGTWRNMYIERPHLQFTGCYISKITYIREGERGFDQHYTPWHSVEYFRYIRFFSEGKVLMMTSADEPESVLPKLRSFNTDLVGVMKGMYKISGNRVTAVLKRHKPVDTSRYRRKNQPKKNEPSHTFHMDLEISSAGKRKGCKLTWVQYSITTRDKSTGEENVNEYALNNKNYPPLIFSRVKSFASITESPITMLNCA